MSIETPEFRHETAKKELKLKVEVFSATDPNTKEEQMAAEQLINDIIFERFSFRVEREDWMPYLETIKIAGNLFAELLISRERNGDMKLEDASYRLGLMIDNGFIDPKKNPHVKVFMERKPSSYE